MRETQRLLELMRQLRDPDRGCAWDLKQNFFSIAPFTLEEAYEVADAIERRDWDDLREELGDLLLQVVFHAQMAAEQQWFNFEDVARSINEKLVRRHPHVFAGAVFHNDEQRASAWEAAKQEEKQRRADRTDESVLAGVTLALPAMERAVKLQKKAASVGFDWNNVAPVLDKIAEELQEVREACASGHPDRIGEELGDLLFAVTNLARHTGTDPEQALRAGNRKFERRFRALEKIVSEEGADMTSLDLDTLDGYWEQVKAGES